MNANLQPAVPARQSTAKGIPENVPLRESPGSEPGETGRIINVAFPPPATRFRESLAKPPRKPKNSERRSREFLSPAEVEKLAEAAQRVGRHGHRDGTMIQIAYRHALRVSELTALRWDQVDLAQGLLHVRRRKSFKLQKPLPRVACGSMRWKRDSAAVSPRGKLMAALQAGYSGRF
jgi:hypothetical protein